MEKAALEELRLVWNSLYWADMLEKADVIIGFGCADEAVGQRASELYLAEYAPWLVFSGGLGKGTKGRLAKSEAEGYAGTAVAMGVPPERILLENRSANTGENIAFTRRLLSEKGICPKKVIAVHQPNMGARLRATLQKQWTDGTAFLIAPADRSLEGYLNRLAACGVSEQEMVSNIVGDFQRMDIYARKGYQAACPMPREAWDAFEKLVKRGYDRYIICEP